MPLLTAGSADGLLYYVMPFIRGESLQTRLALEPAQGADLGGSSRSASAWT